MFLQLKVDSNIYISSKYSEIVVKYDEISNQPIHILCPDDIS